jgi:predicted house-cleaning noncanonical NTP pyrophosphatase (MazG superfamily)
MLSPIGAVWLTKCDEGVDVGKLVRDRIPDIIAADGRRAEVRTLSDHEYDAALLDKLLEEVDELRAAGHDDRLGEAADVYEVLLAIVSQLGGDEEALRSAAARKRATRGALAQRLWLER